MRASTSTSARWFPAPEPRCSTSGSRTGFWKRPPSPEQADPPNARLVGPMPVVLDAGRSTTLDECRAHRRLPAATVAIHQLLCRDRGDVPAVRREPVRGVGAVLDVPEVGDVGRVVLGRAKRRGNVGFPGFPFHPADLL